MTHEHDFKRFPELTNNQMQTFYFDSPHRQITEDFRAEVVKVTDGDTIRVNWRERDFNFPIRLANLAAPELKEKGGPESQAWLEDLILGKEVNIIPTKTRVEKWGRLLAYIVNGGENVNDASVREGHGVDWDDRDINPFPNIDAELEEINGKTKI